MDDVTASGREPYEAPTIEDVPVRAEEQLLAGCKTFQTAGPGQFSCELPSPCSSFSNS